MRQNVRLLRAVIVAGLATVALLPSAADGAQATEAAPRTAVLHDWMLQDHGADPKACFTSAAGARIETAMVTRAR